MENLFFFLHSAITRQWLRPAGRAAANASFDCTVRLVSHACVNDSNRRAQYSCITCRVYFTENNPLNYRGLARLDLGSIEYVGLAR